MSRKYKALAQLAQVGRLKVEQGVRYGCSLRRMTKAERAQGEHKPVKIGSMVKCIDQKGNVKYTGVVIDGPRNHASMKHKHEYAAWKLDIGGGTYRWCNEINLMVVR